MTALLHRTADPAAAARFFRVLADPTRLKLLGLLDGCERSVGDLVRAVGQPQPRVSTHLACLRYCGLVAAERRGKEVYYRLVFDGLSELIDRTAEVIEPLVERLIQCERIGPGWV